MGESGQDALTPDIEQTLAALKPTKLHAVMDLVQQAGIDTTPWATKGDGTPVKAPRANPHFCYEWAFGTESQGFVLCVWHASLKPVQRPTGPEVVYSENLRQLALSLDRVATEKGRRSEDRNRARDQAKRARAFDSAVQRSFFRQQPIRFIVNEGLRRELEELGTAKSTVKLRELDTTPWFVHSYDGSSGAMLIVRGRPAVSPDGPAVAAMPTGDPVQPSVNAASSTQGELPTPPPSSPNFVDQFSEPEAAAQRQVTVTVRDRSAAVRDRVLQRAKGICELCGVPGFMTAAGAVYLETHHVFPLALDGPDHDTNMIALCPTDHRRAHYAAEREALAEALRALVIAKAQPPCP